MVGFFESKKFHLVAWDKLSTPCDMGGWSFKNLGHFNAALCTKYLWRCLFGKGMWGIFIKSKYLKGLDSIFWIKNGASVNSGTSIIWKILARTFPFLANDLSL